VVETFGDLPNGAQHELADALNLAVLKAVEANKITLPPGEHAKRLRGIAVAADELLKRLDAKDGHLPTWFGPLAREFRMPLGKLVAGLLELSRVSKDLAQTEHARKKPGRGAARREGPGPRGVLLSSLFGIYADMRRRFPDSGPEIGYGGPLLRFVRAVHAVFDATPPTDRAVKGAFDRWRRAQNKVPPALK
jgi:hypothetical protein